jgi:hypothetical protein
VLAMGNVEILHHLQRQVALVISKLQNAVGCEATKAYFSLLSHTTEPIDRESNRNVQCVDRQRITDKGSETVEVTQMTLLNEHCMIDTANAPPDDKLSYPGISGLHNRMDLRLAYRDG